MVFDSWNVANLCFVWVIHAPSAEKLSRASPVGFYCQFGDVCFCLMLGSCLQKDASYNCQQYFMLSNIHLFVQVWSAVRLSLSIGTYAHSPSRKLLSSAFLCILWGHISLHFFAKKNIHNHSEIATRVGFTSKYTNRGMCFSIKNSRFSLAVGLISQYWFDMLYICNIWSRNYLPLYVFQCG